MPVNQDSDLCSLRDVLLRKSIQFGRFTLASGQISDIYVDAKLTTCSAEAMPLVGRVFLRKIHARGWFPQAVGGLTLGADPIAFSIARESLTLSPESTVDAFIVRKETKKHGMGRYIEGLASTEGVSVVIIDDVCTSGGSTVLALEKALAAGMRVLGAICLVDREAGAAELIERDFHCQLESVFKLSDLRPASERPCSAKGPFEASIR